MNIERYDYVTNNNFLNYEFESTGPKGVIKKVILFDIQNANGVTYFNLGFGDWSNETKTINDLVITNNQDKDKILATVAAAVLDFTSIFPDMMVYAEGSTSARTRLYQMGISAHLEEISAKLHVFGNINGDWKSFEKNINYTAFLVLRKK